MSTPIEHAERDVKVAENFLQRARIALQQQHATIKTTRGLLSRAVTAFQAEFAPKTQASLIREHIAGEQALKKEIAAGRVTPRHAPIGNSVVDRHASYSAGGTADDMARSNMRTGFRRGTTRQLPDGRRVLIPASPRRSLMTGR